MKAIDAAVAAHARVINLSLGTRDPRHRANLEAAVERASRAGAFVVSAAPDRDGDWFPGAIDGVVAVELDWSCNRHAYGIGESRGRAVLRASGYPREIPGVPPERNLKGVSFAVANASGFVARALERADPSGAAALFELLQSGAYNRAAAGNRR